MKAALLLLSLSLVVSQAPQTTPTPPQAGQRGAVANPQNTGPAPLSAEECKCLIEVLIKRSNGDPISDIEVTLIPTETGVPFALLAQRATLNNDVQSPSSLVKATDNSGRAVFLNLAEGAYTVQAQHEGYFGFTNDVFTDSARVTTVVGPQIAQGGRGQARQSSQQVTLTMAQGATLSGQILDSNRRPATAIQVEAFSVVYQQGRRTISRVGTNVQTDDRGEYRLFWLPPGEYYVRTSQGSGFRGTSARISNYPSVFYHPGTSDPRTASLVTIAEGTSRSGIDIQMQPSTGVTVSGTIVNTIPGGRVGPQGEVNRSIVSLVLVPRDTYIVENPPLIPNIASAAGAFPAARAAGTANSTGPSETNFEIRGVPPGVYDFYPLYNDGSRGANFGGNNSYYSGKTTITVGNENVTGIQSVVRPGSNLNVQVAVTGTPPATGRGQAQVLSPSNLRVQISSRENLPSLLAASRGLGVAPDSNGMMTMSNLVDARYYVSTLRGLPADAYVSELRHDSRIVTDEGTFEVAGSETTLNITISRGGGTIQGFVRDSKQNPLPAAAISLVPDFPRKQNGLFYKNTIATAAGAFAFNGVAPGIYKLYAWEKSPGTGGVEQNADFMREYEALGVSISVSPGLPLANITVPVIAVRH
jgi:hypothetical protein